MGCILFWPAASCSRVAPFSIFLVCHLSGTLSIVPAMPNFCRGVFFSVFLCSCSSLFLLFCAHHIRFVFVPDGRVFLLSSLCILVLSIGVCFVRGFSCRGSLCLLVFLVFGGSIIGLRSYCISLARSLVYLGAFRHACRIG